MGFPDVVIEREDGSRERYPIDRVPTREEFLAKGYRLGEMLNIKSQEFSDLAALMESKGFNMTNMEFGEIPPPAPGQRIKAETVGRIEEPEFRVMTKIGLNYFAAVVGSREALMPAFDNARNYARYGSSKAKVLYDVSENPWFLGRKGHYISLRRYSGWIVAHISILMKLQYVIALGREEDVPFRSTAHFFDLDCRRIVDIEPLRLVQGRALKRVSRTTLP
jgi:hypothetical protein